MVSRVNNTLYSWTSVPLGVRNQSEIRALVRPNGYLSVMVDQRHCYYGVPSPALASGQPGVGVAQTPAGNGIAQARLYVLDLVGPPTVGTANVAPSTASNRVDLHWRGVEEPATGIGVWRYDIYRDNAYLTSLRNPNLTDSAVAADTNYTYWIVALDYHMNSSGLTQLTVRTPAAGSFDPRRTGVKPLGAYWGAGGENIDMNSGNLNYTVPLLKAVGRGSTAVVINLSYNSQQWRSDEMAAPNAVWKLGEDVGYGFGWKLQMGSLRPMYSDFWTISWYLYTDSTGAEYRLLPAGSGLYTSNEGIYVTYDSTTGKLRFNDGSFWQFNSTSWGNEDDAGTKYATLVQDSNGNQIKLGYQTGAGAGWGNSSARLDWIDDARLHKTTAGYSYGFTYTTVLGETLPHLTGITSANGGSENYTFSYDGLSLVDPFTSAAFGATKKLTSLLNVTPNLSTSFQYSAAGEMTQVTLPYGGTIAWSYAGWRYANWKRYREVSGRTVNPGSPATPITHTFSVDAGDTGRQIHTFRTVEDPAAGALKYYWFNTDATSPYAGLQTAYQELSWDPRVIIHNKAMGYQTNTAGNPYLADVQDYLDNGANQSCTRTAQTIDSYGNLTRLQQYALGCATVARTYDYYYLTGWQSGNTYVNAYIRNRLLYATLTAGGSTTTLVQNTYDEYNLLHPLVNPWVNPWAPARLHDGSYDTSYYLRGNVTTSVKLGATAAHTFDYDIGGNSVGSSAGGVSTTSTYGESTNYTVPSSITPNGNANLSTGLSFDSALQLTSASGPNGASVSVGYDTASRPESTTSPTGAVTTYAYSNSAPQTVATVNGRWTKTYLDGLGRTVKVEQGTGSTVNSTVKTEYAACACSPMGKVYRVSRPYVGLNPSAWTTYFYDALGRTIRVEQTGNTGAATYQYVGNTVRITDPSGKWRMMTMDAFGNIVQVNEPNPAPPPPQPDYETYYTYNAFNKLTNVSMTRPTGTQTRSFVYDAQLRLQSTTFPENGQTSYAYDSFGRLQTKTDAKSQTITYEYDSYNRVTAIRRGTTGNPDVREQRTLFSYDTGAGSYLWGRLASVTTYQNFVVNPDSAQHESKPVMQTFSYTQAGLLVSKSLEFGMYSARNNGISTGPYNPFTTTFGYDNEGRLLWSKYADVQWPGTNVYGPRYDWGYNTLGQPMTMTRTLYADGMPPNVQNVVTAATYTLAGQMLSMVNGGTTLETRSYNDLGQLTRQTGFGLDYEYRYNAANDGRIQSRKDWVSGEDVQYQFDTLGRLSSAATVGPEWGLSFTYDGFGNKLAQSVTKGTAPALSLTVDPATNRVTGTGVTYDANGNLTAGLPGLSGSYTYDVENRLVNSGVEQYGYGQGNQRLWKRNGAWAEISVTGPQGQLLTVLKFSTCPSCLDDVGAYQDTTPREYFAGRLMGTDRLGGKAKTYPYGEEKSPATGANPKFATYDRDPSGLDYAQNRYYTSTWGRFVTPDPYQASGGGAVPASWNRYSYAHADPVTYYDPRGLMVRYPGPNPGYCGPDMLTCPVDSCDPYFEWCPGGPPVVEPPPSPPPLTCSFAGASVEDPGWGRNDRKLYGFYMPVYFDFTAGGGTGYYAWTATQRVTISGSTSWDNGITVDLSAVPPWTENVVNTSAVPNARTATFFDAPGWAAQNPSNGALLESTDTKWSFVLEVSVSSGDQTVKCPTVEWFAFTRWATVEGKQIAIGRVSVKTGPTR